MRIPTIYLETTIFNFPFADDAPQYRADALQLFAEMRAGKFRPYTSEYVVRELEDTPDDAKCVKMLALIDEYSVKVLPDSADVLTRRQLIYKVRDNVMPDLIRHPQIIAGRLRVKPAMTLTGNYQLIAVGLIRYLADVYVAAGVVPQKYFTDAFHIAAAVAAGLDCIVSLNFKHIVKHKTILETEYINAREGYKRVFIHTPAEVIDYAEKP